MNEEKLIPWNVDEWVGCYPSSWKGMVVEDAMTHPAKFSSRLIRRIYEHMYEENWLKAGDTVVDPFGGVALGALEAMRRGLRWRGCELEPKFVKIGCENISYWNNRFSRMPKWSGSAVLFQGDSRKLVQIMGKNFVVEGTVSSPPYTGEVVRDRSSHLEGDRLEEKGLSGPYGRTRGVLSLESYGHTDGNLGEMRTDVESFAAAVSSPPFRQSEGGTPEPKAGGVIDGRLYARHAAGNSAADGYGVEGGQLANMEEGDFQGAISSPPFVDNLAAEYVNADSRRQLARNEGISNAEHISPIDMERIGGREQKDARYGFTDGQLGAMKDLGFTGAISSPPYADSVNSGESGIDWDKAGRPERKEESGTRKGVYGAAGHEMKYGETDGQLGAMKDYGDRDKVLEEKAADDFWMAARQIVEQVYIALEPGGHACWVVKDFVKNKERVPFSDQWRQLCEAVGFVTVHVHHAMLVRSKGKSMTLDGDTVEHIVQSKSFFRRLAEKRGSPKIDWEDVICMVKPV